MVLNPEQFLEVGRQMPTKSPAQERKQHFHEIYGSFTEEQARAQADRCLDCGNPYCQWACPVHNYIPNWLKKVAEGKYLEAAELSYQTNSLPEMCGRICPQDRLCEEACTLENADFESVTIGAIEAFISEKADELGFVPEVAPAKPYRVAIVGAGPAGLACADILLREGISVDIYDRYFEAGGLLMFGIPEFKLEKPLVVRRRQTLEKMGATFHFNTEVGKDIPFADLLDYDAVFVGVGTYKAVRSGLAGEDATIPALAYLTENMYYRLGKKQVSPDYHMQGKKVVVLGGGDTSMDCTRTAIRQGASEVICAYRRDEAAMPGSKKEVKHAKEEGANFWFQHTPIAFETEGDTLTAVVLAETEFNAEGRLITTERTTRVACDAVIMAFGFRPEFLDWLPDIATADNGCIAVGGQLPHQTNHAKVFAGGDIVRGSSLVVHAVAEGRAAAESIMTYLSA